MPNIQDDVQGPCPRCYNALHCSSEPVNNSDSNGARFARMEVEGELLSKAAHATLQPSCGAMIRRKSPVET